MNRTNRLIALVQILRRHRHPVTGRKLADELEVSERTLYRDIATLQASGAPVRGEAGIGYVLDAGYDLPPLMFSADELEALMLGARFVRQRGDAGLMRAADDAVAKIEAVLPRELRPLFSDSSLYASGYASPLPEQIDTSVIRRAIRESRKIAINYRDEQERPSERAVWPLAIGYFTAARVIVAWCELRGDFRHFRTDRIESLRVLPERYRDSRARLLKEWRRRMAAYDACEGTTSV